MIQNIKKRDGGIVTFDQNKITEAVWKAAKSVGGLDRGIAEKISNQVCSVLEVFFKHENQTPHVEQIQDLVEKILIENGHAKTAKAYIIYRQEHHKIRLEKDRILRNGCNAIQINLPKNITISGLEELLSLSEKLGCTYQMAEPQIKQAVETAIPLQTIQESSNYSRRIREKHLEEVIPPPIESLNV